MVSQIGVLSKAQSVQTLAAFTAHDRRRLFPEAQYFERYFFVWEGEGNFNADSSLLG
jgi:hypothetical protein